MLVRRGSCRTPCALILIQRIRIIPRSNCTTKQRLSAWRRRRQLQRVTWNDRKPPERHRLTTFRTFSLWGRIPTHRVAARLRCYGRQGFILTGRDLDASAGMFPVAVWPLTRAPQDARNQSSGMLAVGDVRAGIEASSSAVGEGAISISLVHRSLAEF